jgi:hypothetical protein
MECFGTPPFNGHWTSLANISYHAPKRPVKEIRPSEAGTVCIYAIAGNQAEKIDTKNQKTACCCDDDGGLVEKRMEKSG